MWKWIALVLNLIASVAYADDYGGYLSPTPAPECRCQEGEPCLCQTCDCAKSEPTQLVSVLHAPKQLLHDTTRFTADLGYGHPKTLAPLLVAEQTKKPRLTAAEAERALWLLANPKLAPIDKNHKPSQAARTSTPSRLPSVKAPAAPSGGYYVRQYVGTSCSSGMCLPRYRWVWRARRR